MSYEPTVWGNGDIISSQKLNKLENALANIPAPPTKVSDLDNDSGFISSYTETDPVFSGSPAAGITSTDISNWNSHEANVQSDWNQSNSSADDYIKNKPTIPTMPTVNNATLTIQRNSTTVQTFSANASSNVTANITVPTTASDINAQEVLVSGTNIKTINNESILGSGNITVSGGGSVNDVQINGTSILSSETANIPIATTAVNGAMSSSDKTKLDSIPSITVSNLTPTSSDGNNGDIWFVIE